jgi:galactokinase
MLAQVQASMTDVVYRRAKYVIGEIERVEVACEALSQYDLATLDRKCMKPTMVYNMIMR